MRKKPERASENTIQRNIANQVFNLEFAIHILNLYLIWKNKSKISKLTTEKALNSKLCNYIATRNLTKRQQAFLSIRLMEMCHKNR